ncbi:OmpA family protein [Vibrio sp. Y2-5]|uniref:OmpA family protein n=1 Tax=Vibrio sp. Y2-5 TaxID=2743977 RepID=UPI00166169FC|nr:OmpA family protein [Vibrio sp. Y2-5]MBD0788039.1 OmpA family protein [Vibrio sp. Y2-5]
MNWLLIKKSAVVVALASIASGCAVNNEAEQPKEEVVYTNVVYSADTRIDNYFDDQYKIFKDIFTEFTVQRISDREIRIIIPTDYGFDVGGWSMNRTLRNHIADMANTLNDYKETSIWVHGHTDNQGNLKYNIGLSQHRADAVKDLLIANNVDNPRIKTVAEAYEMPRCDNTTKIGKDCNRRVEIVVRANALR